MKKKNTLTSVECKSHSSRKLRRRKKLRERNLYSCSISRDSEPYQKSTDQPNCPDFDNKKGSNMHMAAKHTERQVIF